MSGPSLAQRKGVAPLSVRPIRAAVLFVALYAAACTSVTARPLVYGEAYYRSPRVSVNPDAKPLGPETSRRLLRTAAGPDADRQSFERLLATEQALTRKPLVAGNQVDLLVDGPAAYQSMFAAIRTARHYVYIETYILTDDELGRRMAGLLEEKSRAGVDVRVLYDAVGSFGLASDFIDALRDAGASLAAYRPLNPLESAPWKVDNRDHRKILVVDGRVAFTGGMNVSGVYASSSFSKPKPDEKPSVESRWRDTQIRIEGPAVAALVQLFLDTWSKVEGTSEPRTASADPASLRSAPAPLRNDSDLVRIISTDGGDEHYEIYEAYLAAISHAQRRIWVTQAYFVPNREMRNALKNAAARGVDVRILVPGLSDMQIVLNASRAQYQSLLRAGVRIYEREDAMVHAKTAVVDGVWSTVGSSNLDMQSFLHNDEANAVIVGRRFGRQMEDLFRRDVQRAREIDPKAWRHRPLSRKVIEQLASLFEYWI